MERDLIISVNNFPSEQSANIIGVLTLEIMKSIEERYHLDISKLTKVIITFDFESALQSVATDFNHNLPPTFTNSSQAKAVAKLFSRISDVGLFLEYNLILSADFFNELFNDDLSISLDDISPVRHRIHHELIHVHEHNKNCLNNAMVVDDYDDVFLMTGMRSWSEYLANYLSSPTATDEIIDSTLYTLEVVLSEVVLEIKKIINQYRVGLLSLSAMHLAVTERIKLISNMYAYAYGYIDGVGIDIEKHFPVLSELLSNSPLSLPLHALRQSFLSIKSVFDEKGICDFSEFDLAIKAVRAMYLSFGLKVERASQPGMGLFIEVF